MTKLAEKNQFNSDNYVFKCYCAEHSYLDITQDPDDGEIYISITQHPTRLTDRIVMAWRALRGVEFSSSNEVVLLKEDISKLQEALILAKGARAIKNKKGHTNA
jgi:hypothetical protein